MVTNKTIFAAVLATTLISPSLFAQAADEEPLPDNLFAKSLKTVERRAADYKEPEVKAVSKVQEVAEKSLDLSQAVKLAIDTHPVILAQRASKDASHEETKIVRSGLRNTFGIDVTGGHETSSNEVTRARVLSGQYANDIHHLWRNSATLSFRRMLYDRRGTSNRLEASRHYYEAAKSHLYDRCERIGINATEAFLDVMRYRRNVKLSEQNVAAHEETYARTKKRSQSGAGTVADVEQARARLARAKASAFETKGALRDAEAFYIQTFGVKPDSLHCPEKPAQAIPQSLFEAIELAQKNHHGIAKLRAELKGRESEIKAAKASYAPRFDLELSASRTENQDGLEADGWDHQALIVGSFSFNTGGRRRARSKKAHHLRDETQHRLEALEREVEKEVRKAWTALETTKRRLTELRRNVKHNEAVLKAYRGQFNMGKRTLLDLLDATTEIFNSKVSLNNGEVVNLFAHYRLLFSVTNLLNTLEVPVEEQS